MPLVKNLNNPDIVRHALLGADAVTKNGNYSTDHHRTPRYRAPYTGDLPKVWQRHLNQRFRDGKIRQVIYSYSTPIAWCDEAYGWVVPDVHYSTTTSSKHQTHLWRLPSRRYVSLPWDATDEDLERVMTGKMIFSTQGRRDRRIVCTIPGPNYVLD